MPLLDTKPNSQRDYSAAPPLLQGSEERKRSKNVQRSRSKNVSPRRRRTSLKDTKTLERIQAFGDRLASPSPASSVASSTPSTHLIPVWELTGDVVKAVFAAGALLIADKPAHAFSFNLTPEATAAALAHQGGFVDRLKRRLDGELKRAGLVIPYLFAVDIDWDKRLHVHGAFTADLERVLAIKGAMLKAWGEASGPARRYQTDFDCLNDDGWATYCMRNQRKVAKIIGPRTFTVTQPLTREAKSTYEEARRIMRSHG